LANKPIYTPIPKWAKQANITSLPFIPRPDSWTGDADDPHTTSFADFLIEVENTMVEAAMTYGGVSGSRCPPIVRRSTTAPVGARNVVAAKGTLGALDDIRVPSTTNTATRVPRRLTPADMAELQRREGTEFALIYVTGPGRNGGGGQYLLIRGTADRVTIPAAGNVRLIYHTHPTTVSGRTVPLRASTADQRALRDLQRAGSPQRLSRIVTEDGEIIEFTQLRNR
jgi:hypothetical protein